RPAQRTRTPSGECVDRGSAAARAEGCTPWEARADPFYHLGLAPAGPPVAVARGSSALQPVALEAPVEPASAQSKRLRRLTDVAVEAHHRFLDQEALDVLEAHAFQAAAAFPGRSKAQVSRLAKRSRG